MKTFREFITEVNIALLKQARKNRKLLRKPLQSKDSNTVRQITGNDGSRKPKNISGEKKKTLYKVMRQQKATNDFNVYHGSDSDLEDNLKAGASTTLNPSVAKEFGKTVHKIRVPKGTPFVRIGGKWKGKHGGYSEDEIQLPAGKLSVRKKGKKNYKHISYEPEIKEQHLEEKAPEGAKYERMIKHIKASYAKDGKLTNKEKSIAFATAWKNKRKNT